MKKKVLLITSVILLSILIWSITAPATYHDAAPKVESFETRLAVINAGLQLYYQKNKTYPSTNQELKLLLADDTIFENSPESVDSWGRELIYRFPSTCGNFPYDLYSSGLNLIDECLRGDDQK